jgi:broad specificity phosphatase PhoE
MWRSYPDPAVSSAKLIDMAALVHLVRHAELDNPDHLVAGSLPGFGLSPHGLDQARRVGRYLGPRAIVSIWSSPLESALRTAEEIAARSGVPVRVDEGLRDWELMERWRGNAWASLQERFGGEMDAYLVQPHHLPFSPETLDQLADRVAEVARRLDAEHPHGDVVVVSHQDPIRAGLLRLTGSDVSRLHDDTLAHGSVVTLRPGVTWVEETVWDPSAKIGLGDRSDLRVVSVGAAAGPSNTA